MNTRSAKRVVLGVTGSIAAYKACEIASTLTQRGIDVQPVMTQSAQQLVGPATFEGLTGNRVITSMFDSSTNTEIEHIATSTSADLFIVAPATANMIGKAARGIADDWLSTALMVTRAPILFAPAMNDRMWKNPIVQENLSKLKKLGHQVVDPEEGFLVERKHAVGRLAEPEKIVAAIEGILKKS